MDQLQVKKTLLEPSSVQMGRSASPTPSHESMRSDLSMNNPLDLKESSSVQMGRSSPCPSHESMRSDLSMNNPLDLKESKSSVQMGRSSPCPSHESMRSDMSMNNPLDLKESSNASLLKLNLRSIFQCLREGMSKNSALIPLNEIYTELYITEGGSGVISNEHEIRWIETVFRRRMTEDTQINLNDIFKPLPGQDQPIRTVLTKGVAGIGKTVSVQKFILDWAEGKANQDIYLIFPLPFRELNLLKDQTYSLKDLLHFFMGIKQLEISPNEGKIIFIFDGLDECRLSLDFQNNVRLCDVTKSASVDVLLTNLIVGNLLPSALIWITSRPAAADLIPSECVDRVTEVRGFSDPQKEEYFRKRIRDQSLAEQIISHLKSSGSLYIMCHIPVFCWISATVLEKMLSGAESGEIPKTLTQMYTDFLILQTNIKHEKDYEKKVKPEDMILKLGKLAFQQLEKQNLIFYEDDLREFGIDVQEAAVYSGLCTQIFREESGLFLEKKVYCFLHLSVQEHLAALYVHLSFVNQNTNELDQPGILLKFLPCAAQSSIFDLHQSAVKKALQSTSGHLDLFLRFLLGMSLESNQTLLQGLLTQTEGSSDDKEQIVKFIKAKIKDNPPTEKLINLFHCLNELNDHDLVEEIQHYLKSGSRINTTLTASQWSAVVFVLLTSGQKLDVFDLNEYIGTLVLADECLHRLQPVLEASRTAMLCKHNLTRKGYSALVSALTSKTSCLKELNLAKSNVNESELKQLCAGLGNPQCQLERLRLESCGISDKGCTFLALALRSNPSHLKELDLSKNKISNSGLKILSAELQNPLCKLELLWMRLCGVTDEGCASLALFLKSNHSHLRGLNLSGNKLGDLGIKNLADGLENPHCKLEILRLRDCSITHEGCVALASALRSNPSHLKELDLSGNKLRNIGLKRLSGELENSDCNLEILRLNNCDITSEGCAALAEVLKSHPLSLRELELGWNKLGDSGVQPLFAALENPNCKLKVLRLRDCKIAEEGCDALASTLKSNPSHLRELDLSQNKLRTLWVKMLCTALEKPDCNLEILRLEYCGLTDESCAVLASALRSNPSHLRELDLYRNNLGDSGRQLLSALKDDPNFTLQKLQLQTLQY
ncbi:NACHT, LRR and PYD domains-containing protein 3 [Ctenopharyngodon idella]|uniref:NACHT, LRR and PYD domains-containing protein 3 n=1 Tax=Ctenopharyngodon idella TaxID=7959 RepID=UPI00222E4576|nr:NACHT, LRR and PYD domains-containing protein 3 [Ctenopharyngodon idella]XP_051718573.1 NACHT, LRR and PYD domains-containing protein 3 [Ctenopharyngodon idella]